MNLCIGDEIKYENEIWYIDNTDEDFKDDDDETMVFILPLIYKDADIYDKAFNRTMIDYIGKWIYESEAYERRLKYGNNF